MSITAELEVADWSEGCPTGNVYENIIDYINENATVTIDEGDGTSATVYVQSATPTPSTGAIWYRLNADSFNPFPIAVYSTFNGRWIPFVQDRRLDDLMFTETDPTGLMDANGAGLFVPSPDTPNIAGALFGWQLANGQNGSINIKNRFIMAGYKWNGSRWVSSVKDDAPATTYADQTNGGREGISLDLENLPAVPYRVYDSAMTASVPKLYGGINYNPASSDASINLSGVAQLAIQPVNPLYVSSGVFQWMGYGS